MLADRYGRRPMLIRACLGGAVVLALMGLIKNVETLIVLRLLQGCFTGTMAASQSLISSSTPTDRHGFALGALGGAVFSGAMAGSFIGGFTADMFGYRVAFFISGLLLLAAALLVLFCVQEQFKPHIKDENENGEEKISPLKSAMPVLILMGLVAMARQYESTFLPLLVQEINGGIKGASLISGMLFAVSGVAGMLASFIAGYYSDKLKPGQVGIAGAILSGILLLPQALSGSFYMLFPARFGMVFSAGALETVFQTWLSKITPAHARGTLFGWAASIRSIGWMLAPILAGTVASVFGGPRAVFLSAAVLYIFIVISLRYAEKKNPVKNQEYC